MINRKNLTIAGVLYFFTMFCVKANAFQQNPAFMDTGSAKPFRATSFIIYSSVNNLVEFKKLVKQAERLKPFGTVKINISTLADKAFHETPEGGSPWHEYANQNPTPFKFFPDPKIAPFLPAGFVKKNRQLMIDKARILKENGMEAAFFSYEPNFLPAAFFDAYPEMMGPRVDHPRRSRQKAFAPCIDVKETREMYASMMAEMLRAVPEITAFSFKTNDAGAGICWSDWLYSGPNGPSHCKNLNIGDRTRSLFNAFQDGASRAGRDLAIYMNEPNSNFSDREKEDIQRNLPSGCYYRSTENAEIKNLATLMSVGYPVTGIFNPRGFFNDIETISSDRGQSIFITFRAAYDRANEDSQTVEQTFRLIEQRLLQKPGETVAAEEQTRRLAKAWAGSASADNLSEAFAALDKALTYKNSVIPRVSSSYWGVNARYINRPLVINPKRLSEKEEDYFLPYIFNVSKEEARMDYTDIHGGHGNIPSGAIQTYLGMIRKAYLALEKTGPEAPQKEFLRKMAVSLRIHASIMRSCGNFAAAQVIREKNADALNGPPHRPDKLSSWTGHPDIIAFNDIMRDELDNAGELIHILKNGGMEVFCHSADHAHEDTFLAGPDIIEQIEKKRKIMLDHWLDIEEYLSSPFK